jgi:thiopurine S-methyltransferase
MQANFWHDMWATGVMGFHQAEMNAFLTRHWQKLGFRGDETILVPLCGKSLDMLWLAKQGHTVLGVELSQKALDEFFYGKRNHCRADNTCPLLRLSIRANEIVVW